MCVFSACAICTVVECDAVYYGYNSPKPCVSSKILCGEGDCAQEPANGNVKTVIVKEILPRTVVGVKRG